MIELVDYSKLDPKKFWDKVKNDSSVVAPMCDRVWKEAQERLLSRDEAIAFLNGLFIHSHARILEHSKALAKHYPTKQLTKNKLAKIEELWWVDHFTAGISRWSTLNWFSSNKTRTGKDGKPKYNGASTHFVCGYHDLPFYIIPLIHGAWHEPHRNKDSISIEMVNAGGLTYKSKDNKWDFWARSLPQSLVQELPPVRLDKPYRGVKAMQPFTEDQIVNSITLKRIVRAALVGRLAPERMSQHSDWRAGKTDMGPLWPYEEINRAMFNSDPIFELDFIQQYEDFLEDKGQRWDESSVGENGSDELDNPEYGQNTPTHDEDARGKLLNTTEVQRALAKKSYNVKVDGRLGPETHRGIKQFQMDWNKVNPSDTLKIDGIAGQATCQRLQQ